MSNIDLLTTTNHWWDTGKVNAVFMENAVRDEIQQIFAAMEARRVLAIVGPRRTGKSTLIYQIIDQLLKTGTDPAHIVLFNGDSPLFTGSAKTGGEETISSIVDTYVNEKLHKPIIEMKERIYIFIDEIHFLKDWQIHVKSIYDLNPNVKFIISGSSSIQMFLGARESLLGRITDINVLPFCFDQFLRFFSLFKKTFDYDRYAKVLPARSLFDDPAVFYHHLDTKKTELAFLELALNEGVKSFLLNGGYPEFFKTDNILYWQKMLTQDIIDKGLYRDIVSFYRVTNPLILERLLYLIAANSGGEFAYAGLGGTIGIDTTTASTYINYLSQAHLITVLENYSPNTVKVVRKNKKIYVSDNGIRNAIINNDAPDSRDEGFLAESACVQMARAYCEDKLFGLYFWRDKQVEADIIIDKKTHLLPVEIKYRNKIEDKDLDGLYDFMKKYNAKTGIVITKNILKKEGDVYFVPLRLAKAATGIG
ncbi:ATPase [Spirochaetia bacterium]|nr:ATPase [Spirochaetia bacterium]